MAKADLTFTFLTAFAFGVLLASFQENLYQHLMLLMVGVFLFSLFSAVPRRYVGLAVAGCLCGAFYYSFFLAQRTAHQSLPFENNITLEAMVEAPPSTRDKYMLIPLKALPPHSGTFTALYGKSATLRYGDKVSVKGGLSRAMDGAHRDPLMIADTITMVSRGHGSPFKRMLFSIRTGFIAHLQAVLPREEAALAAGLTLGDQNGFSDELKAAMAKSGTTHLVALSGYNIAILVAAIESLLSGHVRRRFVFWFTLIFIVVFVVMVGGQASIVRAAIMGIVILFAKDRGRMPMIHMVIMLSGTAMLLHDPRLVRWDLGFQLSFLSLLGIVYVLPALQQWLRIDPKEEHFLGWKENLLASVAAQLTVMPLLVQMFETTSLSGIFATVAIINAVPLSMLLGAAIGIVGWVSGALAAMLGWVLQPILAYQVGVIYFFARLSIPVWNPLGGWGTVAIYYALLVWFVARYYPRKKYLFNYEKT